MSRTPLMAAIAAVAFAAFQAPAAFAQEATLDQAKDLVKKGREYLRQNGCKKTFEEITHGTKFKDPTYKELYLYVYDEKLVNLAHGGNDRLPGKDLREMRDKNGKYFNQDLLKAAKAGGGAVEFDFLNPNTHAIDPKVGWAEMETKTDCGPVMVGSGVYRRRK